MSHAQALGVPVALPGRCLRRCDDCGQPTWVPNAEGDAVWVVCESCVRGDGP